MRSWPISTQGPSASLTDEQRYDLHQTLAEKLGRKDAAVLMEHLPPVGWADVATKQDLDAQTALLAAELRGDMISMEARIRSDMTSMETGIRSDMTSMETGIRGDMTSMEARIRSDMTSMERRFWLETRRLDQNIAGLRTDMEAGFRRLQTRMLTALVGIAGLVLSSAVMFR